MSVKRLINNIREEAHIIPIVLSLFLVPIFFNPFFVYSFTQGKEIVFKSIILLTLIILSLILIKKKTLRPKNIFKSSIFILLIIQLLIYLITNTLSNTPVVTLYGTYSRGFGFIIEMFLGFFIVYCSLTLSEKNISKLLKITFVSGVIVAICAILQKAGINPLFINYDIKIFAGRAFGFLGNPSYLGQFMLLISVIGGYFSISEKATKTKLLFIAGTLIVLGALIFSGTRTAIAGLIVAIILISIKYVSILIKIIRKALMPIVIAFCAVIIIIISIPSERYSLSDTALRSLYSRMEIWKGAINLITQKPLTGYGEETFYIYFPEVATKKFFTLEEDINTSADRVHNESLEIFFSHGIFAFLIYLALFGTIITIFFKTRSKTISILALLIIANIIQDQLSFPDITICVLISFCLGGMIALSSDEKIEIVIGNKIRYALSILFILLALATGYYTVYKPSMSQLAYTKSHENYSGNYSVAINKHKEALDYTPYYSELWYDLMFIDPSSMEKALFYLEQIEKDSGNVLAWKGNFYANTDPQKASEYYIMALEKNPYNPNWIRAFADMLYKNEDYENALYMYDKYLESVPDFWKWAENIDNLSEKDRNSYETFLKHTPFFWGTVKKINNIINSIDYPKLHLYISPAI